MKLIAMSLVLLLAGCATTPAGLTEIKTGCIGRGLFEGILDSESLELTDIRIGRLPDTGRGTGMRVHFMRGMNGPLGQSTDEPRLAVSVGDWQRTCTVVMAESSCLDSDKAYSSLASLSLPIGHAFDDPVGITVLHGTQFFLNSRDGEGNDIRWSYYGSGHPAETEIDRALKGLEHCAAPASAAFHRAGL